jgi:Site-specific recombinases, DNA invertase Pin homologs
VVYQREKKKMIKAAIYARYSSDNQREESITAQVRACTEYCQKKGYAIVKTYADEARSALTDNRPEFQQMVSDARAGLFDVLVIHKLDRFARNRYDSAFYKRELRRAGVRLESVLEHLDDSPESVLLESLLEGLAEYYSKNLGRKR